MKFIREAKSFLFALTLITLVSSVSFAENSISKSALIVIDMQAKFITRGGNQWIPENMKKVDAIIRSQVEAIREARRESIPIIFLEYRNYGSTNEKLKDAAEGYGEVAYFIKTTDGMFSSGNKHKKELVDFLEKEEVGTLIITGANGGACVRASINGALAANYSVVAFSQGIADFNYKDFIYPYDDKYNFKPSCKDCTFREADELDEIFANYKGQPPNPGDPCDHSKDETSFPQISNTNLDVNKVLEEMRN